MRHVLALGSIFFLAPLLGKQLILDEVMSKEDQKKTRVIYLTPNQRSALEVWVNQNCNCAPENPTQATNLFLSINIMNGQKIQLTDNSIWEIDPQDYTISEAWLASIPIKIIPSEDPDFPYLLVNKNTGIGVRARKATMPPATPQPAQPMQPPAPAQPVQPATPPPAKAPSPAPITPKTTPPPKQ
jgi:hypothetical protein